MGFNTTKEIKECISEKQNEKEVDEGKIWPQVLAILIGCIGAFTNGLLLTWPSPYIGVISQDKENYDITEEEAAYFTILPSLGLICGSLIFYKLNDIIGRKRTLMTLAVPHLISWILIIFAKDVNTFYASRLISGFGDAALFTAFPMYIGEISTPKVRGSWGNAMALFIYAGQFLMNIIGSYFGVKQTAYICISLPILFLVTFSLMPETPYYYVMVGKEKEAKNSLKYFRRKPDIETDYVILKADVERQLSESGTWKDLFTIRSNRKALLAGVFLRFGQQMSGTGVFAAFTQFIFMKAGGNISSQASSMIFSGICLLLITIGSVFLDKLGRKKAYMWSSFSCGIVLFIESLYFYLDQFVEELDVTVVNWVPLACMIGYLFCFAFGLGIIPTLMLGELFSASIKIKGLCLINILFGLMNFLSNNLFNLLNMYVGLYCPFLVFSISCFVCTVLTVYVVPETRGKTLEEIQQDLKGK